MSLAAEAAGMSRESAYRLRSRGTSALFALLWDELLRPAAQPSEGHSAALGDGRILRVLERCLADRQWLS